ncbi:putative reverse transcriptase zinc-binding domain-containing protein [Helianthus anomalus]
MDKLCMVANRASWADEGLNVYWNCARQVLSADETEEVQNLTPLLRSFVPRARSDAWCWRLHSSDSFSVANIKHIMGRCNRSQPDYVFSWNNWVPKKGGVVAWMAVKERLPTKSALASRNIDSCTMD